MFRCPRNQAHSQSFPQVFMLTFVKWYCPYKYHFTPVTGNALYLKYPHVDGW